MDRLLEEFSEPGTGFDSSLKIADELVGRKVLTRWQVDELLCGKNKGFLLGSYCILEPLGRGGMAAVYLAEHRVMRRRCAIKVLPTEYLSKEPSFLDRFHREAQAVAALDHPNIVRAYDVNKALVDEKEIHFLVMEYVAGQDFRKMVEKQGVLEYCEAADLIRQSAQGLAHAHARGLVHRDVKPANLLVDTEGVVKVLDLGLAKFFDDDKDPSLSGLHQRTVLGTADYMAPEQARNSHDVDARADIYSLGHTFYFLLVGHPPFPQGTAAERLHAHQKKLPAPIKDQRPDVPSRLVAIIDRMTAKRPGLRYQTATEVAAVLGRWLDEETEDGSRGPHSSLPAQGASPTGSSRHAATRSRLAAYEETDLDFAPLDDEEPSAELSGTSPGVAPTDSKQSQPKGDASSSTPQLDPPSTSSSSSRQGDSQGTGMAELLEELPELPELQNGLMAALPENGPTGPPAEGGPLAAPIGRPGALSGRVGEKPQPRNVVSILVGSLWFWIGITALLVVVLIIALLHARSSTDADPAGPRMEEPSVPAPPAPEQVPVSPAELPQAPASPAPPHAAQRQEGRVEKPGSVRRTADAASAGAAEKGGAVRSRPSSKTAREAQKPRPRPNQRHERPAAKKAAEATAALSKLLLAGLTEFSCHLESFDSDPQSKLNLMVKRKAEEAANQIGLKVTKSNAAVMHIQLKADNVDGRVKIVVSAQIECRASRSRMVEVWQDSKQIRVVPRQALESGNLHAALRSEVGRFFRPFTKKCQEARAEIRQPKRRGGATQ